MVAVVEGKGQAPLVAQNPKGSAKGGKTKNKSKGKSSGSKGSSKGPTGKNRVTCLRRGKAGHFAANCPSAQQTGGSSPKKRAIDLEDPTISMVMNSERNPNDWDEGEVTADEDIFYDVKNAYVEGEVLVRAGGWLTNEPDTCIQDQGASSFLIGSEYALRHIKWLEMIGYPMDELIFKRCDKSFKFGGDASGYSRWMVELPVRISGHPGRVQAYIIYGATSMLFGRPLLEALQAEINFGESKMRLLHQEWHDIPRGRQGAMLLRLAAEVKHPCDFKEPVFDFRCEDDHDNGTSLRDLLPLSGIVVFLVALDEKAFQQKG